MKQHSLLSLPPTPPPSGKLVRDLLFIIYLQIPYLEWYMHHNKQISKVFSYTCSLLRRISRSSPKKNQRTVSFSLIIRSGGWRENTQGRNRRRRADEAASLHPVNSHRV